MTDISLAYLKEVLHYDPETGVFTWLRPTSNRVKAGEVAGGISVLGYRYIAVRKHRMLAHRLAWRFVHGEWPLRNIDHKNGDPSDNRIANLREADQSENCANNRGHRDSATGLKGVSKKRSRWEARLSRRGTVYRLGVFDSPDDAHAAYIAAAKSINGEFARWR